MEQPEIFNAKSFKRVDANFRDKLKSSFLKRCPHYMLPGYNLHSESAVEEWDIENVVEQYQEFPYHSDLPRPLLPPAKLPRSFIDGEDPALELLSVKHYMDDDIQRLKDYFQKHKTGSNKILFTTNPVNSVDAAFNTVDLNHGKENRVKWYQHGNKVTSATIPKYLATIAEIIDMDPDPYFEGTYNWYYTGGTLNHITHNNSNILLFPFKEELVVVPITDMEDFAWKPSLANAGKYTLDGPLYELRHSAAGNTHQILGRHKYQCDLYTLIEQNNKYILFKMCRDETKVPLTGADLNPLCKQQYCTVDAERTVTLWDTTKMRHISKGTVAVTKVLHDAWGSISFQSADPDVIIYTDRCCIHYLDTRVSVYMPSLSLCPKYSIESCEGLSLDIASRRDTCRYIGTYHSLLMCDNRVPDNCVLQKWTHQFKSTPLMGAVVNREDTEIIVLSSQLAGERAAVLNTWTNEQIPHSYYLPHSLLDIRETLDEAQMQGLCLDPYLRSRLDLSNVGSSVIISHEGHIYSFSQNSIGDIYYQCISHDDALDKHSGVNFKSICILNAWENAISKQKETIIPLTISYKSNMQHLYENLVRRNLLLKETEVEQDDYEPSWKQSLSSLLSYIDILAPELLAVWDVCEEVTLPTTALPHQKVLNWLESTTSKGLLQSQEEVIDTPVVIDSKELVNMTQHEQDVTCLEDSNVFQELFLPKVRTKPAKKRRNIHK